ncbi:hypothetical protein SEVIR_9G508100v4 [Setaria viridis]
MQHCDFWTVNACHLKYLEFWAENDLCNYLANLLKHLTTKKSCTDVFLKYMILELILRSLCFDGPFFFFVVHGVEYAFGAHDFPTSGVFEVEPRQCPGFRFRKSIFLGTTCLDPIQVRQFMELQSVNYNGDTYHLITKNCNHFCKDMCYKLTGNKIPKWVNRLARIGAICNCLLPESLKISPVGHDPNSQSEDSEKRRLRNPFSCFSSISSHRQLPSSSPFPPSPVKERLAHCSSRKSSTASLRNR